MLPACTRTIANLMPFSFLFSLHSIVQESRPLISKSLMKSTALLACLLAWPIDSDAAWPASDIGIPESCTIYVRPRDEGVQLQGVQAACNQGIYSHLSPPTLVLLVFTICPLLSRSVVTVFPSVLQHRRMIWFEHALHHYRCSMKYACIVWRMHMLADLCIVCASMECTTSLHRFLQLLLPFNDTTYLSIFIWKLPSLSVRPAI